MHAIAAAKQVPTKLAPWSMPVDDIICGLTKMIYAMVINVVKPNRTGGIAAGLFHLWTTRCLLVAHCGSSFGKLWGANNSQHSLWQQAASKWLLWVGFGWLAAKDLAVCGAAGQPAGSRVYFWPNVLFCGGRVGFGRALYRFLSGPELKTAGRGKLVCLFRNWGCLGLVGLVNSWRNPNHAKCGLGRPNRGELSCSLL